MAEFRCGMVGRCKVGHVYDHPVYGKIKVVEIISSMFISGRIEHIIIATREAENNG